MIETPNLTLRRATVEDNDTLHDMTESEAVNHFIGGPRSRSDSFAKLLRNEGCWSFFGYGMFIVEERETGSFVGQCGLFRGARGLGDAFDAYPEAGWVIVEEHWGKGYASEAMLAVFDWAQNTRKLDRIVAIIAPENTASAAIAKKLGLRETGMTEYLDAPIMQYAWVADANNKNTG